MEYNASAGVEQLTLEATILRADGTIEHLGEIAFWHKNPLVRSWMRIKSFFRR